MMKLLKEAGFQPNEELNGWIRDNYQETIELVKLKGWDTFQIYNTLAWTGSINYADGAFTEFVLQFESSDVDELKQALEI